jgi:uncharacterized Zn finger protein
MTKALNKTRKSSVALTPEMLRQATTGRYYHRGEEYFEIGLVKSLKEKDGMIHATVHGSHPYKTTLWLEDGMAGGQCTCPLGREGEFCKHLVATGLTWIEAQASGDTRQEQKAIQPADIEAWLQKQPPEKLVETIMSQAMSDDEFYNVLKFLARIIGLFPRCGSRAGSYQGHAQEVPAGSHGTRRIRPGAMGKSH